MVYRKCDDGVGGWHEPPYTWEEEMEFYKQFVVGDGKGVPVLHAPDPAVPPQTPPKPSSAK